MKRENIFNNELLQEMIHKNKIDILLVSSKHNVRYLTGGYFFPLFVWETNTHETQYLPFIGIPAGNTDKSFFICRPWEKAVTEDADIWLTDCIETPSLGIEQAVTAVAGELKSRGFADSRIGVEMPVLPAEAFLALSKKLPNAEFVNITPLMDLLRAVKTEREIKIIKNGTRLELEVINKIISTSAPGSSTLSVAERIAEGYRARDIHFLYALVCAGPSFFRAASPNRKLQTDRIMHIDSGALTEGYVVETCRTGHIGQPTNEADTMLGLCSELEQHMLPYLQPGIIAADIQKEANSFVDPIKGSFSGKFIAHGIGMIHHERPVISLGSEDELKQGMVLSIEMEFRSESTGHVKIEDMVAVGKDKCEVLSPDSGKWLISEL